MKVEIRQGMGNKIKAILEDEITYRGKCVNLSNKDGFIGSFGVYLDAKDNHIVIYFPSLKVTGFEKDWKEE